MSSDNLWIPGSHFVRPGMTSMRLWTTVTAGTSVAASLCFPRGRSLIISILRRWDAIASVRAPVATAPICSGHRVGHGREIGPRCRGSEIARQCGAVVRQERSSGKPGGLFLCVAHTSVLPARSPYGGADRSKHQGWVDRKGGSLASLFVKALRRGISLSVSIPSPRASRSATNAVTSA